MALFGLFGKKDNQAKDSKESFFLDQDEAQSLGNIEFMRTPQTIRRTFPKGKAFEGGESIIEISSSKKKKAGQGQPTVTPDAVDNQTVEEIRQVVGERRSNDDSLDMFLKMAKDIRK